MHIECKKTPWTSDPFAYYAASVSGRPSALLESARAANATGRYSIAAKDPFLTLRHEKGVSTLVRGQKIQKRSGDPFPLLEELLEEYSQEPVSGLPPFVTGAIGYLGYECKDWLEPSAAPSVPKARELPDLCFHFFDRSLVWDHERHELWMCALRRRGAPRFSWKTWEEEIERSGKRTRFSSKKISRKNGPMRLERSFNEKGFERAVRKAKDYIRQGEIFQANLSQRFSFRLEEAPRDIYARLRAINPSPFFGIFDGGDFQIVSGSPERLLKLEGRTLQTRPIAGTRSRGRSPEEDQRMSLELLLSEKERAEHIMLVDLERNDLGRVAEYGSVRVDELMALEDYSHVKHIVSNVRATLREGLTGLDALRASFPGGTITGAPKVRCMRVIDELEPVARGPYTGSLGYFSFTGGMDFNILIRSLAIRGRRASLHVGAGIVADSDPKKEHHETLYKAEAVLAAVFGERAVGAFLRRSGAASAGVH